MADSNDDAPKHRLLLELGRGGMGTVYVAVSRGPAGFSKLKVVKRLRAELAADPDFLAMFLDEARLSARLNHPNIAQTNEVGFDGLHYFIEMEYLEGQSLETIGRASAKSSPLPLATWLYVLTQVLAGLEYAHTFVDHDGELLKIVHRDVSPHNVFVTYEGSVKLLDFGIAKATDSSAETRTGVVKGKATYMAPEQAAGKAVDRRADLFAVGVILWQALTRRRLWEGLSDSEVFARLEASEVPRPSDVASDVPEGLERICMRALAPRPDDRYADAATFQADLDEWLETTGERFGQRQLAKQVNEIFAERRASVRAEINAQLRTDAPAPSSADIPALGSSAAYRETASGALTASKTLSTAAREERAERATRHETPQRRARRVPFGAIAATVGVVAFGGWLAMARRPPAPVTPTAPSASGRCATNAACVGASASTCVDGACVALAHPKCKLLAEPGDAERDDTLWIGTMFPTSGSDAETGTANERAVDLARRDFAAVTLPALSGHGTARRIAVVACDDDGDPDAVARHLVEDLHVPAVIGFHGSSELIDLATSMFLPRGTLAVTALNRSSLVSSIPHTPGQPRLVWRTTASSQQMAMPLSLLVSQVLEPQLRATLPSGEDLRVAVVRPDNAAGLGFMDAVYPRLRFNGKSALENRATFQEIRYEARESSYASTASSLVAFRPHVVLFMGEDEPIRRVLAPVERESTRTRTRAERPRYVLLGAGVSAPLVELVAKNDDARRRFLLVDLAALRIANARFAMHYNSAFGTSLPEPSVPRMAYDAFYVVAYAAYVAGDAAITGARLSASIGRLLPPGTAVDVGPSQLFDAVNALRRGDNVDLQGAGSALDFDVATGDTPVDQAVYCLRASGDAIDVVESGVVYDAAANKLAGALQCP